MCFVIIARTAGIFCSYYAFSCCKGSPSNKLTNKEIMFAVWAAYIRGAIAFGLSSNLTNDVFGNIAGTDEERQGEVEVVQSTILALVIITTFFFGGFTPMVKSCLMGDKTPEAEETEEQGEVNNGSVANSHQLSPSVTSHEQAMNEGLIKRDQSKVMSVASDFRRDSGFVKSTKSHLVDQILANQYL